MLNVVRRGLDFLCLQTSASTLNWGVRGARGSQQQFYNKSAIAKTTPEILSIYGMWHIFLRGRIDSRGCYPSLVGPLVICLQVTSSMLTIDSIDSAAHKIGVEALDQHAVHGKISHSAPTHTTSSRGGWNASSEEDTK